MTAEPATVAASAPDGATSVRGGAAGGAATAGEVEWFKGTFDAITRSLDQAVLGKTHVIRLVLTCLVSEGHLLLEDVPGTGKTMLARGLANCLSGSHARIQFTPDLLPSDITGVTVYDQQRQRFEFHPGPVFHQLVLADEINRASPKTQAALLEVMEEGQVTVDGVTHAVPQPFMVIATQNPIEQAGTYRLPEAQLDRFLMKTSLGYPDAEATEEPLLASSGIRDRAALVSPVAGSDHVTRMSGIADRIYVDRALISYVRRLAEASRELAHVRLGVSARGCLALVRVAKTWAAAEGRSHVVPQDVVTLAPHVLRHRLLLDAEASFRGVQADTVVEDLMAAVPAPVDRGLTSAVRAVGVITPLGRAVSVLSLVALLVQRSLGWLEFGVLALVGGLLVSTALVLVLLPQPATGRLRLDPVRVGVGEPATVEVGLRAGPVPPLSPTVRLEVAGVVASLRLPVVPPGEERSEVLEVPGLPRGVHPVGPLLHVRSDPLGLAGRCTRRAAEQALLVRPRVVALRALDPGLISDLDGVPSESPAASDLAFHTLREYVAGDDLRHVHWRSSAKADQLLVRQYVETRRSVAVVLVDDGADCYADEQEFEPRRLGGRVPALRALRDDFEVRLACGDVVAQSRAVDVVLDATCRVELAGGRLHETARRAAAMGDASSLVVVVSGSRSPRGAMRLAAEEFPSDATRLLVRVDRGAPSRVLAAPRFRALTMGRVEDLVGLVAAVAGSPAA